MDTYTDCDKCGERFWSNAENERAAEGWIKTVELPNGECKDLCVSCAEARVDFSHAAFE